jgi:hypothetical protein
MSVLKIIKNAGIGAFPLFKSAIIIPSFKKTTRRHSFVQLNSGYGILEAC